MQKQALVPNAKSYCQHAAQLDEALITDILDGEQSRASPRLSLLSEKKVLGKIAPPVSRSRMSLAGGHQPDNVSMLSIMSRSEMGRT
jgi:hypothetical protein